jgi:O-antigen ligase
MRLINVLACTAIGLGTIDFVCYYVSGDVFGESSLYTFSAGLEGFDLMNAKELVLTGSLLVLVCLTVAFWLHRIPSVRRLTWQRLLASYAILTVFILSSGISRYAMNSFLNFKLVRNSHSRTSS